MLSRRYLAMWCAVILLAACAALAAAHHISWFWIIVPVALVALGLFDLTQQPTIHEVTQYPVSTL